MSKQDDDLIPLSDDEGIDDELLANAIPIDDLESEGASSATPPAVGKSPKSKIRTIDHHPRHQDSWARTPNITGQGAIHVKTFVAKLRPDAIEYLDHQINEWLDSNPEYEVKFVTTNVGELMSKMKEPALFVNVWV